MLPSASRAVTVTVSATPAVGGGGGDCHREVSDRGRGHVDRQGTGDLADHVVAGVGDEQVARSVQGDPPRAVELGGAGRAAIPGVAGGAGAGDGVDDPVGRHFADDVVARVGDEEVARGVHGHGRRSRELGGRGRAAVAAVAAHAIAIAGDGVDDPVGCHLADHVVVVIDDEHVARGVDGHAGRVMKLGGRGGPAVSGVATRVAGAGEGMDDPVGRHLADDLVGRVGDEDVAGGVDRHVGRVSQLGGGGRAVVAAVAEAAVAGDVVDDPVGRDLADPLAPV